MSLRRNSKENNTAAAILLYCYGIAILALTLFHTGASGAAPGLIVCVVGSASSQLLWLRCIVHRQKPAKREVEEQIAALLGVYAPLVLLLTQAGPSSEQLVALSGVIFSLLLHKHSVSNIGLLLSSLLNIALATWATFAPVFVAPRKAIEISNVSTLLLLMFAQLLLFSLHFEALDNKAIVQVSRRVMANLRRKMKHLLMDFEANRVHGTSLEDSSANIFRNTAKIQDRLEEMIDLLSMLNLLTSESEVIQTQLIDQKQSFSESVARQNQTVEITSQQISQLTGRIQNLAGDISTRRDELENTKHQEEDAISMIADLETDGRDITATAQTLSSMVEIVEEVANRTHILSINSAIEAARAGEAGAGFSVLAQEVGVLASAVRRQTGEMGETVAVVLKSIESIVGHIDGTRLLLGEILASLQKVRQSFNESFAELDAMAKRSIAIGSQTDQTLDASREVSTTLEKMAAIIQSELDKTGEITELSKQIDSDITTIFQETRGLEKVDQDLREIGTENQGMISTSYRRMYALDTMIAKVLACIGEQQIRSAVFHRAVHGVFSRMEHLVEPLEHLPDSEVPAEPPESTEKER